MRKRTWSVLLLIALVLSGCGVKTPAASRSGKETLTARHATEAAGQESSAADADGIPETGAAETTASEKSGLTKPYKPGRQTGQETAQSEETSIDLQTKVRFTKEEIAPFLSQLSGIRVSFPREEGYGAEAALDRYRAMREYDSGTTFAYIKDGRVDEARLRETVKQNTQTYLAGRTGTRYTALSDQDYETVFRVMTDTLNRRLKTADAAQLDRNLARLILCNSTDSGFGAVTDDDVRFLINVENCRNVGGEEKLVRTVAHETNHLAQICSDVEKEHEGYDRNVGLLYRWDDLEVNPLSNTWLTESAAERLAQNELGRMQELEVYKAWCKMMDSLSLSTMLDDNIGPLTVPGLCCQGDLDRFFACFGAEDREAQLEIIRMLYACEVLFNEPDGYYANDTAAQKHNNAMMIQTAVAEVLMKNHYRTLALRLTEEPDACVADVFDLLIFVEADLNRVCRCTAPAEDYQQAFLNRYAQVQRSFFELMGQKTGIPAEELFAAFDAQYQWSRGITTGISALYTQEERAFVEDIWKERNDVRQKDCFYKYAS